MQYIYMAWDYFKKYWQRNNIDLNQIVRSYIYNEQEPFSTKCFENKKDIGIGFSGGGIRSFGATIGQIRALSHFSNDNVVKNLLADVKYVSCISGSTWALIPYTYLNSDYNDDQFIGYDVFGDINKKMDENIIKYDNEKYLMHSLTTQATNYKLIEYIYEAFEKLDANERCRIWPYMLGKIFLEPYGIFDNKLCAPNIEILGLFKKSPLLVHDSFKLPYNKDRPFIITSSVIVDSKKEGSLINTDYNPFIMTPFYTGTLTSILIDGEEYGKKYINTYAFHSYSASKKQNILNTEISDIHKLYNRFNLHDMMAASSAAYSLVTEKVGINRMNPAYRFTNLDGTKIRKIDCADGGILDNTGILPLLQRQVENIILFVNSNERINPSNIKTIEKTISTMLRQLFLGNSELNKETYLGYFKYINKLKVFENENNNDWNNLLEQMYINIKKNDIAFVELNNVKTLKNDKYQIPKYIVKKLIIIYLYQSKSWTDNRLTDGVRNMLESKKFYNFPYYNTLFENTFWYEGELLQMSPEELNLLSDLTYFNIIKNKVINTALSKLFCI